METEPEKFHRRLRVYDRHKAFLVGGIVLCGVGLILLPWGLGLVAVAGALEILAGLKAREGGRSAVDPQRQFGFVHPAGEDLEIIGQFGEPALTTREREALTNQQRLEHGRRAGAQLIVIGIVMIVVPVAIGATWLYYR